EHNMSVVMNISDRVTVMNQGQVIAEGPPTEIAANTQVQNVYLGEFYGDFGGTLRSTSASATATDGAHADHDG
ncbi:MAG: ABC transporter ATP-binding protein, partial [Chloroflexi bacterium]|nr:ABC transporter ATP-binding protein [Chloroflexota bacterium]